MNKTDTSQKIIDLLNLHAGLEEGVSPTTKILADTKMDSVKVMDLILELEDMLDLTIPLNRLAEVETVGELIHEVEKLQETTK